MVLNLNQVYFSIDRGSSDLLLGGGCELLAVVLTTRLRPMSKIK